MEFEETYYGVLVIVLYDENQVAMDVWFHPASYREVKSFRKSNSKWFKFLVENFRGYEFVRVCESKEDKSIRQAVDGVNSQIKAFDFWLIQKKLCAWVISHPTYY